MTSLAAFVEFCCLKTASVIDGAQLTITSTVKSFERREVQTVESQLELDRAVLIAGLELEVRSPAVRKQTINGSLRLMLGMYSILKTNRSAPDVLRYVTGRSAKIP